MLLTFGFSQLNWVLPPCSALKANGPFGRNGQCCSGCLRGLTLGGHLVQGPEVGEMFFNWWPSSVTMYGQPSTAVCVLYPHREQYGLLS